KRRDTPVDTYPADGRMHAAFKRSTKIPCIVYTKNQSVGGPIDIEFREVAHAGQKKTMEMVIGIGRPIRSAGVTHIIDVLQNSGTRGVVRINDRIAEISIVKADEAVRIKLIVGEPSHHIPQIIQSAGGGAARSRIIVGKKNVECDLRLRAGVVCWSYEQKRCDEEK